MLKFPEEIEIIELFEAMPTACLLLTPDLNIVAVSEAYAKATMIKSDKVRGRYLFDVFPDNPEDESANGVSVLRASLDRVLGSKKHDVMAIQKYDIPRPADQGGGFEVRYWAPANTPVLNKKKELIYIIHRVEDVTESVMLKNERINLGAANGAETSDGARLRQSQRMEAMGQLAGGVAHDFNNILHIMMLTCENLLRDRGLGDIARDEVNQILKSADSAASLTRQLLAFSRQQVLQPAAIDFNEVTRELQVLYRRLLPENIQVVTKLHGEKATALIDRGQFEQVLMNLILNARDAIRGSGSITVETKTVDLDKASANGQLRAEPGRYVMLSVSDTGAGMDPTTQARIFEPFFSTKGVGRGTGLGLATVYGIVNQNKGTIWVYSEVGNGTTFKVYLPLVEKGSDASVAPSTRQITKDPAGRTIMVVEDQAQLRQLLTADLRKKGFEVLEAGNGAEALAVMEKIKSKIDLVITDVVMPEMGGPALAEMLAKIRPETKLLYLSGYADDVLHNLKNSKDSLHFLEKPFRRDALINKIYEILESVQSCSNSL